MKHRASSLLCLLATFACDASLTPEAVVQRSGGGSGPCAPDSGPSNGPVAPRCEGKCCPANEAKECFPLGNPSPSSGAECLAVRDNTGQKNLRFRQTFSKSTTPPGFAASSIADVLARASALKSDACRATDGTSGFIQLIDIDTSNHTARVGFAKFAPDLASATRDGLCFVEGPYDDPTYRLAPPATPANWPRGLPPPMPLPWQVKAVKSYRNTDATGAFVDFDVAKERQALLARFAEGGDLQQYTGVHHINEATGYMHGFAPVVYIVQYSGESFYNAVPLREAEIVQRLNDPEHPNCIGSFLGDNPDLPPSCVGSSTLRLWGCPKGRCGANELAPTSVKGYFLLTELEQIYNPLLGQTLCHAIAGAPPEQPPYPGWATKSTCRSDSARWNPADPVNGLPPGDWCAATNSKATPECHDAWQSVSYATFQAFPIQDGTCPAL